MMTNELSSFSNEIKERKRELLLDAGDTVKQISLTFRISNTSTSLLCYPKGKLSSETKNKF